MEHFRLVCNSTGHIRFVFAAYITRVYSCGDFKTFKVFQNIKFRCSVTITIMLQNSTVVQNQKALQRYFWHFGVVVTTYVVYSSGDDGDVLFFRHCRYGTFLRLCVGELLCVSSKIKLL